MAASPEVLEKPDTSLPWRVNFSLSRHSLEHQAVAEYLYRSGMTAQAALLGLVLDGAKVRGIIGSDAEFQVLVMMFANQLGGGMDIPTPKAAPQQLKSAAPKKVAVKKVEPSAQHDVNDAAPMDFLDDRQRLAGSDSGFMG